MKKVKSRKGFTLIELVVTVAILSIVCCMGVGIFATVLRNYGTASSTEMEQEKATQIENYLVKSARTATKVCFIKQGDNDSTEDSYNEIKKEIPKDQGTYIFSKVGSSDVEIYDIVPKSSTEVDKISTIKVSGVKNLTVTIKCQNVAASGKFMYLDYKIEMIDGYTVDGSVVMNNLVDNTLTSNNTEVLEPVGASFIVCQYDENSGSTDTGKAIIFAK